MTTHKKNNKINDSVFDNMLQYIPPDKQDKLTDFTSLFYYFIICYSRTCFKKDAHWTIKYKGSSRYFDYETANDIDSHGTLLQIQHQMYEYRRQYSLGKHNFYTYSKIQEINAFANDGLYNFIHFIMPTVKLIAPDVMTKLNKYSDIKLSTYQPKLNLAAIQALETQYKKD